MQGMMGIDESERVHIVFMLFIWPEMDTKIIMILRKCSVLEQIMSIDGRLNEFEFLSIIVSALEHNHVIKMQCKNDIGSNLGSNY
jgi:hypothetical protein